MTSFALVPKGNPSAYGRALWLLQPPETASRMGKPKRFAFRTSLLSSVQQVAVLPW